MSTLSCDARTPILNFHLLKSCIEADVYHGSSCYKITFDTTDNKSSSLMKWSYSHKARTCLTLCLSDHVTPLHPAPGDLLQGQGMEHLRENASYKNVALVSWKMYFHQNLLRCNECIFSPLLTALWMLVKSAFWFLTKVFFLLIVGTLQSLFQKAYSLNFEGLILKLGCRTILKITVL